MMYHIYMNTLKKKPIQIYIETKQAKVLDALAHKKGVARSEIIRLSLDRDLSELPIEDDPAMNVIGLGKSGKTDLAEKHDKYYIRHISGKKKIKDGS